jgi:hypothetical protein
MIASQPALWNSVSPILNDVAVVGDEEERSTLRHIDLHTNQAVGVTRKMVKRDALAKVHCNTETCH